MGQAKRKKDQLLDSPAVRITNRGFTNDELLKIHNFSIRFPTLVVRVPADWFSPIPSWREMIVLRKELLDTLEACPALDPLVIPPPSPLQAPTKMKTSKS